jgi:hypothetical protein
MKSTFFAALGVAVALAGGDKLAGVRGYRDMFRHLGWSESEMRAAAAGELAGGLLMIPRATRALGGAVVAATSAAVLAAEVNHGDTRLALPRSLIMICALIAAADCMVQRA